MVRYATKADSSSDIARLILQTDDVFRFLFGSGERSVERIRRLVEGTDNMLSYRNTAVFEGGSGTVAGAVIWHAPLDDACQANNDDYYTVFSGRELVVLWLKSRCLGPLDDKSGIDGVYISNVCVSADARGAGIGTQLIQFVERQALRAGHTSLWLDVASDNDRARKLYERLGFAVESRRAVLFKRRAFFRMRKQLVP